jgi:hypothetical protein
MKVTDGEEVQLHSFLNWALDISASTSLPLYSVRSNGTVGLKAVWTFREKEYNL